MKQKNERPNCPACNESNPMSNGTMWLCGSCGKKWVKFPKLNSNDKIVIPDEHHDKILSLLKKDPIPVHKYYGDVVRFGVLGDTHLGSIYEHLDVLNLAYKVFKKEGIDTVYHTGDICEGENMHPGQTYEIHIHGAGDQSQWCIDKYPMFEGIKTYFITGSHDLSFYKRAGIDIGNLISDKRPDLIYLGKEEADIFVKSNEGKIILRLSHPGKGTAYALSYHVQKYLESLSGGQKPNVLLMGHYHKAEYLPCYRNVFTIQSGCIQGQTSFMRRNNLASHIGFWIVEMKIKNDSIMSFKCEFFAHYEDRIIKEQ